MRSLHIAQLSAPFGSAEVVRNDHFNISELGIRPLSTKGRALKHILFHFSWKDAVLYHHPTGRWLATLV